MSHGEQGEPVTELCVCWFLCARMKQGHLTFYKNTLYSVNHE
jgi:hypothetical protein